VPSVHLVHKGQRREGGEMDLVHDEPSQEVHGPSLRDHYEPSTRTRRPFEIQSATWLSQEPARVRAGPAQTGPTRPVSSPDPGHQGPVSARSALTIDQSTGPTCQWHIQTRPIGCCHVSLPEIFFSFFFSRKSFNH
jgi:hypothetical protein